MNSQKNAIDQSGQSLFLEIRCCYMYIFFFWTNFLLKKSTSFKLLLIIMQTNIISLVFSYSK